LLPVAVLLSVPVFGLNVFGILAAIPRLLQSADGEGRAAEGS
jgi:hypothetical protein